MEVTQRADGVTYPARVIATPAESFPQRMGMSGGPIASFTVSGELEGANRPLMRL